MAAAAQKAGVTIAGGDTKVVEHGKADRMYITTTGIGRSVRGLTIDAAVGASGRQGASLRADRRSRHHDAAGARRTGYRGGSAVRHALGVASGRGAGAGGGAGHPLDARSHARRRSDVSQRTGARLRPGHRAARRKDSGARRGARRLRTARAWIPCTSPTKGSSWRWWRRSMRRRRSMRLQTSRPAEKRRMIGEVREQPAGSVLVTTRYGGSRIVDMLVGDPLPRIC